MSDIHETHETTRAPDWTMLVPDFGYGTALDTGRQALDRWTHGLFEYSRELNAFAMARWQEDLEAWKALGNCRSLDELFQCQCGFVQKAASDYMAEAGKLTQVMVDAANAALRTAPSQAAPAQQPWDVAPATTSQAPRRPASSRTRPAAAAQIADDRSR